MVFHATFLREVGKEKPRKRNTTGCLSRFEYWFNFLSVGLINVGRSAAPACRNTPRLTRQPRCGSSLAWWRILSPRRQPRRWLIPQPKGYAAFILFPHLKMIPPNHLVDLRRIDTRRSEHDAHLPKIGPLRQNFHCHAIAQIMSFSNG
jgi:hypothetical protein